jgi:hypothetical protein
VRRSIHRRELVHIAGLDDRVEQVGHGHDAQWSEIGSNHGLGTVWAQNGIKRRQPGTDRSLTPWPGLPRPLDSPTNGRDFDPMVRPRGTSPNGHFGAALKAAGTARARKYAQDGHKAKRRPFGAAHIQF